METWPEFVVVWIAISLVVIYLRHWRRVAPPYYGKPLKGRGWVKMGEPNE